jgi:hypothetical protein
MAPPRRTGRCAFPHERDDRERGPKDPAIGAMIREINKERKGAFKVFALSLKIFSGALGKIPAKDLPKSNLDQAT